MENALASSVRLLSISSALVTCLAIASPAAADSAQAIAAAAGNFPDTTETVHAIDPLTVSASPGGPAVAVLSPSAPARVLSPAGNEFKIRISGWQLGTGGRVVFIAPGVRIPVATLDEDHKGMLHRGTTQGDPATGQEWTEVSFEAYAPKKQFVASADLLWRHADDLMNVNCSTCHARHPADHLTANQWAGVMRSKKDRIGASADQLALMTQYVQKHARDMAK